MRYASRSVNAPPLYPYARRRQQPYAVEVAPNTYVIQPAGAARETYPPQLRRCKRGPSAPAPAAIAHTSRPTAR